MDKPLYLDILSVAAGISIALATAFIARRRGFNPVIWFFAGALLILVFLPSAKEHGMGVEASKECRLAGNITGVVLLVVSLALERIAVLALAR